MNQQQQIETLLKKIQQGFYDQDNDILKIVSSSKQLFPSLSSLHTIKERKRVILRVLKFSIFIELVLALACLLFTLIILKSFTVMELQFDKNLIYHFVLFILFTYISYRLFASIHFSLKIINSVKYLDEFTIPHSLSAQLQKIENIHAHTYQQSRNNPDYLKRRFAQQRNRIQIIGCIITFITLPILIYCFSLPPSTLIKSVIMLPFFLMLGLGLILSPGIHNDELKYLYGTESVPFKFYPRPLKVCLVLALFLCFMMDLWRQGVFSM